MRYVKFKRFGAKNFKNHIEAIDLTIPESGITLISGPNGSGKTSIIEILFFTLFGRTPEGLTPNDVVNNKMDKDCVTFMEYDIHEEDGTVDNYKCTRYSKYKSIGNSVVLSKNDNKEYKTGHQEVVKEISKLWTRDVFRNTLFFAQKVKDFFMDLQDSDQKQIFKSILRTQDYENYKETAKSKAEEVQEKLKDTDNNIEINNRLIEESKQQVKRLEQERDNFYVQKKERIDSLKEEINSLQSELDELEKERDNTDISKLKEEYNFLVKSKNDIENGLNNIEESKKTDLENLENQTKYKIQEVKSKFNENKNDINDNFNKDLEKLTENTNSTIEELQNKINELTEKYNSLSTELNESIEKLRNDKDNEISKLQEEIDETISKERELTSKESELDTKIENINKDLSNIDKLISGELTECPFCKTNVDEHTKQRFEDEKDNIVSLKNQYEKERDNISQSIADITEQRNTKNKEKEKLQEDFEKDKNSLELKYKEELDSIQEEKNKLNQEIKDYKDNFEAGKGSLKSENVKQIKDLEEKLNNTLKQIDEVKSQKVQEIEDYYSNEVNNLQNQLNEKDSQINKVEEKINNYNEILNKINNISNQIQTKNENLAEKEQENFDESQIEYYQNKINEYENQIESFNKEKEYLNLRLEVIEFWKKGFSNSGIPSMLIDEAIPFMNRTIREYLDDMTYGRYMVTFDTLKQNKSGDFKDKISINVFDNVTNANLREQFSGGQTRLIDIATILTLSDLQSHIQNIQTNLLIFDEVFDALDDDNIGMVSKALRKISKIKSIIIISHTHIDQLEPDEHLELYN